jgi:hypothetical protein
MSETKRERALIEALGCISMFCDFRPATATREEVMHLLAAIRRHRVAGARGCGREYRQPKCLISAGFRDVMVAWLTIS